MAGRLARPRSPWVGASEDADRFTLLGKVQSDGDGRFQLEAPRTASTRVFERLALADRSEILMNSPRRPDGPPVKDGLPYSAIAHLAEDVVPFIAMANGLRERG